MGWIIVFIFIVGFGAYLISIDEENKNLITKNNDLKNSIKLIEKIIEIQKNTHQNLNSVKGILNIDISEEDVELKEPTGRSELTLKAVGSLHLHHDEFNFLSTTQTRNIKLSNILKTDLYTDGLRFYLKNRQRPITFTNLDTPTAIYHLFTLFNNMNKQYSTYQWEDPENFILELTSIVNRLKTKVEKL